MKYRFTFLTILLFVFLRHYISFRKTDKEIEKYFQHSTVKPTFHFLKVNERIIHYAEIGSDSLPLVVFVHGSPGSWTAFIDFFKDSSLYNHAKLFAVDRLGFGKSGLGKEESSIQKQAHSIAEIIKAQEKNTKAILVGHSFGGPVVARLAMDNPEKAGALVLVAGSIDPALEKKEWFRPLLGSLPIRYILPLDVDVSNREISSLKGELIQMQELWSTIHCPVTVIQGEKDDLVPPGNAAFAKRMLLNAPVKMEMIPGMNHFIPWRRPDLIKKAVLEELEKLKEK